MDREILGNIHGTKRDLKSEPDLFKVQFKNICKAFI